MTTQYTFTNLNKWILSRLPWINVYKPSKRSSSETAHFYQNGPLNHLPKMPTFETLYRAKYPDVEIRVRIFGTRYSKNNTKLQCVSNWRDYQTSPTVVSLKGRLPQK